MDYNTSIDLNANSTPSDKPSILFWLLIGYLFLYIERPWESIRYLRDVPIERPYMIFLLFMVLVKRSWTPRFKIFHFWMTGFLIFHYMSSPFAYIPAAAFDQSFEVFKVFTLFYLITIIINTPKDLDRFLFWFLIIMSFYLAHSLKEFGNGRHEYRMGMVRMMGVDEIGGDPNYFSQTIYLSLPIWWAVFKTKQTKKKKVFLFSYLILALTCIVLTGSRGGYIGILIFLVFLLVENKGFKLIFSAILITTLLLVTWQVMPPDKKIRFETLFNADAGPANAHESAEGRITGMKAGLAIFKQRPMIGCGPGGDNFIQYRIRYYDDIPFQAHSLIGQLFGELGLIGAFFFIGPILTLIIFYFLNLRAIKTGCNNSNLPKYNDVAIRGLVLLLWGGCTGHNMYRVHWLIFYAIMQLTTLFISQNAEKQMRQTEFETTLTT
jgi:hypothetical protein